MVPVISNMTVINKTILVCRLKFFIFLLLLMFSMISSHTVKPNPPIIIRAINVIHTNQSPEYGIMLFLPSKSNPALQNADIEWKSENHKPLFTPKSGINLMDNVAIPINSIINVYIHILFTNFTKPLNES